jgi:GTPase SAR1 family protein
LYCCRDTAGQERFRTLTNAYFRGAAGAVLMYDITSRSSFTNVLSWMESISEHGSPLIKIALVGHKIDLEDDRQVSVEEGQKLAETYNCLFFESSSRAGKNCAKVFNMLAQEIKKAKDESNYIKAHNSMPATEASRRILAENDLNSSGSQSRGKTSCCAR